MRFPLCITLIDFTDPNPRIIVGTVKRLNIKKTRSGSGFRYLVGFQLLGVVALIPFKVGVEIEKAES